MQRKMADTSPFSLSRDDGNVMSNKQPDKTNTRASEHLRYIFKVMKW